MAIQTGDMRERLAIAYGEEALYAALYTSVPGASAGTEVAGGGYVRQPLTWSAGTAGDGQVSATASFSVPAGATIRGAGVHGAASGSYLDGGAVVEQAFPSAGTYDLTLTFTQS